MDDPLLWIATGALLAYAIYTFNRLIGARNACANARAGIDVNLSRRHQLIPNLVQVVRGYASHEQATLTRVTQARSQAMAAVGTPNSPAAESVLGQALAGLTVCVEAYPELRADGPFIQLMQNLTEAEEQISASRRAFNAHVMQMNNLVQQFPTLLVAKPTGFKPLHPYTADSTAHVAPPVNLTS